MIDMNKQMGIELIKLDLYRKINSLSNEIVQKTKKIQGCIIYDEYDEISETDIDFIRIIEMYGDKTGYEVACNEIRIQKSEIDLVQSFVLLELLSEQLYKKYNEKMVLYLLDVGDCIELRFHSCRQDEKMWLKEVLNDYNEPIIRYIAE